MDANHFYGEMIRLQQEQLDAIKKVIALLETAQQPTASQDVPNKPKRTRTAAEKAGG